MAATQTEAPEGERLARVESKVESLIRDMSEVRADIRELRTEIGGLRSELKGAIDRNFLWTLGIILAMWVTLIVATLLSS